MNTTYPFRALGLLVIVSTILLRGEFFMPTVSAEDEKPISPVPMDLKREVDFAQDVVPILRSNCIACHNTTVLEGELNLETPADMLKGGASGPSIIAGDPAASFLFLVASRQSEPVMPPLPNKMNAHKLTGEEVWKLQRWIELGAKGDATRIKPPVSWTSVPAHLQPVYAVAMFPREEAVAAGRGRNVEILSLTDATQGIKLIDPELDGLAHRDFVNAVAVHPSGQIVASAGYRSIKIWEQAPPAITQHVAATAPVVAAQTSFSGRFLVLADQNGLLQVISAAQGRTWNSAAAGITAVAVDEEGRRVAYSVGNELKWTDLDNPAQQLTVATETPVQSLLYVPGGVLAGHADGLLRLWTIDEQQTQLQRSDVELKKHASPVVALRGISSATPEILSLAQNGEVVLWDWNARAPRNDWSVGGDVIDLDYHVAGKRLATVHADGRVVVWNEQKKQEREFRKQTAALLSVEQADEDVIISKALFTYAQSLQKESEKDLTDRKAALVKAEKGVKDAEEAHAKTVAPRDEAQANLDAVKKQIADSGETEELKKKLAEATKPFDEKQKAFTDSEQTLVRARKTQELEQASVKKAEASLVTAGEKMKQAEAVVQQSEQRAKEAKETLEKSSLPSKGVRFINAQEIQVVVADGQMENWNLVNGRPLPAFHLPEISECARWLKLANGHACILQASGASHVVDLSRPWKLRSRLGPPQGELDVTNSSLVDRVTALAFSPDGKLLASGGGDPSRDGELLLWDWQTGKIQQELAGMHSDVVLALEFSRDGSKLLSGAADKFVKIIDVATGKNSMSFEGHTEHVLGVSWMADGLTVASASADKSIKVWNTQDGSQKRTISTAGKQVTGLKFIGTTDKIVSSSGDKVVRMHQVGNGSNYRNLSGSENYLYAVAVTRGEELVVAAGQDGMIRVWNGQNGQILHTLPPR